MQRHFIFLGVILGLAALSAYIVITKPARQGLDVKGGIRMTLRAKLEDLSPTEQELFRQNSSDRMKLAANIIQKRIDILGVVEPDVRLKGTDQIIVDMPGYTNEEEARNLFKTTARLEFRWIAGIVSEANPSGRYEIVPATDSAGEEVIRFKDILDPQKAGRVITENDPEYKEIIKNSELIISGDDLKSANVIQGASFSPEVQLNLKPEAQDKFANATTAHLKDHIVIVLDNKVISAPVVQSPNLREPVIQGDFTIKEASRLADLLNAGALPIPLNVEQVTRVEPILGKAAWERILMAGYVGAGFIALFMLVYYLLPGFLAVVALGLYILFSIAIFKWLNVTFSLPAIAGFILSMGMAVDANILIFERMKEELRSGKTLLASVDAGFKRAFTAIFDSNMCTIITCLILYYFGTGPVQGFATTLALGVAISFFTAITCTRTLLYSLVGLGIHPDPKWFGLRRQWVAGVAEGELARAAHEGIDFVARRKWYYLLSAVTILIGLVAWFGFKGIRPGIDFAGGSELQLQSSKPIQADLDRVQGLLRAAGFEKSGAQFAEGSTLLILHVADTEQGVPVDKAAILKAIQPLGTVMYFAEGQVQGKREQNLLYIQSDQPLTPDVDRIKTLLEGAGFKGVQVQAEEEGKSLVIRVPDLTKQPGTRAEASAINQAKTRVLGALRPLGYLQEVSFASISPRVQREILTNAIKAVLIAAFLILLYITLRFAIEGGWSGLKFGIAATVATLHDTLVVLGSAAILGYTLGWQINSLFVTALLTLIGFSVHDTIVVFDRIRENLRFRARGETFDAIVNKSILQTLARSINTSFTVVLVLIALLVWGSVSHDLRHFYVAMLVGVITGTYSSIFNASQIVVDWENWRLRLQARQAQALRATATSRPIPTTKPAPKPLSAPTQDTTSEAVGASAGRAQTPKKKKAGKAAGKPPKRKRRY